MCFGGRAQDGALNNTWYLSRHTKYKYKATTMSLASGPLSRRSVCTLTLGDLTSTSQFPFLPANTSLEKTSSGKGKNLLKQTARTTTVGTKSYFPTVTHITEGKNE
jgi:hypothetical protein